MKTYYSNIIKRTFISMFVSLVSISAFAQNIEAPEVAQPTIWTNPVFIVLLSIIILLLFVIIVLGDVLKGTATHIKNRQSGITSKAIAIIVIMWGGATELSAQTTAPAVDYFSQLDSTLFYVLVAIILFEMLIIGMLLNSVKLLLREKEADTVPVEINEKIDSVLDKFNASVAIEEEGTIMFDHEYDGIRELDNNLPPWWKYGFYISIVWSFAYLIYFHFTHNGPSSSEEYTIEVKKAEIALAEHMKNSANLVDETNVKLLTDASSIETGKQLYIDNCAVCHKADGGGNVGPNLTDDYWIHGGSINDIFKTIKHGYSDRGMKAWKDDLSPSQIAMVTSYVMTLHGTNPTGAKEKQGDLYQAKVVASDTTVTVKDTISNVADTSAAAIK